MTRSAPVTVFTSILLGALGCSAGADESPTESASAQIGTAKAPIALSGDYRFAGDVQAVGRLTVDVIDTRMPDATARLAALREVGAACTLAMSNTWRCTKMHPTTAVPAGSLAKISARGADLFASFGATTGSPVIVSEGESLVEWEVPQDGSSSVGPFTQYRYLDLQGDLVKIILPGSGSTGSMELIVKDAMHLAKWESVTVSEGRWRFHQDMALVILLSPPARGQQGFAP